jgi:hypothetical protein
VCSNNAVILAHEGRLRRCPEGERGSGVPRRGANRGRGRRGPIGRAQMPGRGLSRGADSGGHCRKMKRRSGGRKSPRGAPRGALPSHGRQGVAPRKRDGHASDPLRRSAAPHSGAENDAKRKERKPADRTRRGNEEGCPPTPRLWRACLLARRREGYGGLARRSFSEGGCAV